jgi:MFS family permease
MAVTCYFVHEEPLRLHSPAPPASALAATAAVHPSYHSTASSGQRAPPTGCVRLLSLVRPFFSHDFRVVFLTRFIMQLGICTVQEYLLFYLSDEIGQAADEQHAGELWFYAYGRLLARSADQAVTLLFVPVLLGAMVSSVASGLLSDAMGGKRKQLLYWSGGVMAAAGLAFAVTRSFSVDLMLGLVFGLGYGAFSGVDWALAADVLPNPEEFAKVDQQRAARLLLCTDCRTHAVSCCLCSPLSLSLLSLSVGSQDMGLWSLSLVVPQVLAAPLSGAVLDFFTRLSLQSLGYSCIFMLAAAYFMLGTWFLRALEGVD